MLNYVLTNSKKRDNMETTGNDFLERIKKIQTPVNDALEKYFNGSLDNSGLKLSENEVKKTQQMLNDGGFTDWKGKKLAVDGVRGKRFEDSFNKYMQSTVYDPKVETLQRALNVNGFRDKNGNQLLTDGKYGPKTDSAVMAAAEEYRNMNNSASEKSADMPDTIDDYIKNDNKSKTIGYLENIRQNSPESFDKIMNELEQNGIDINDIDSIVGSVTDNAKNADLDYDASLEDMFSGAEHPVYKEDKADLKIYKADQYSKTSTNKFDVYNKDKDRIKRATKAISDNAAYIKEAAKKYGVNPAILGACIYTEQYWNYNWIDVLTDVPAYWHDTTVGVAQVKISTAKALEDCGYIEVTKPIVGQSADSSLSREELICEKLTYPKTCIMYAAAYLKYFQDRWKKFYPTIDGSTAVLATLYNQGEVKPPHSNPGSSPFGVFARANYENVKKILN